MRALRRGALGALLAILVTLALLELSTRALLPERSYEAWRASSLRYRYHPVYNWSLLPGRYRSQGALIHVNRLGLRGREIGQAKPGGTFRILCLGGSSTFNYHARRGLTWPRRLQDHLESHAEYPVQVINAGTPGYSSYQSSLRFEHELADLEPDLVLVYHLWNDLKLFSIKDVAEVIGRWDRHGRFNEASTLLDPFPFLDTLSRYSQFTTHARFAGLALWKRARGREHEEGWIHTTLDRQVTEEGIGFFRSNLERIVRTAASRRIALGIIDQPLLAQPESGRRERSRIHYDYTGFDHRTLLGAVQAGRAVNREMASRPNVWHLDTDAFPKDLDHMRDHVHLTDRGLARLAEILGPRVGEMVSTLGAGSAARSGRLP